MGYYGRLWDNVDCRLIEALSPDLWIAGGAIRDYIMGRPVKDVDIATKWLPHVVKERCQTAGLSVIETGVEHGTVTVADGTNRWEVTTLRKDVSCDGRNAVVQFGCDIEEDLARRDFTINAMAVDLNGKLIDPFGGMGDCNIGLIQCVGNPIDRFNEDLLRILRALRFSAVLDCGLNGGTWYAMQDMSPRFCNEIGGLVSIERVMQEFNRAFEAVSIKRFLIWCWELGLIQTILPEFIGADKLMQPPMYHPEGDVWTHTKEVVEDCPPEYRWHGLLHDVGKMSTATPYSEEHPDYNRFDGHDSVGAGMIPATGERLKWPTKLTEEVALVARYHMQVYQLWATPNWQGTPKRRFQNRVLTAGGHDGLKAVLTVLKADHSGLPDDFLWELEQVTEVVQPILMGRHLIDVIPPGPEMGQVLKAALDYQLEHDIIDVNVLKEYAIGKWFNP